MSNYDFSKHIDQTIIEAENAKLAAITARRLVAQKRHTDAIDAHTAAVAKHKAALNGDRNVSMTLRQSAFRFKLG